MVTQKRTLIVEPEKDIRDMLRVVLEQEGFEVWEAGKQALEQIQNMPDLVLLEFRLPVEVSGLEMCKDLKQDDYLNCQFPGDFSRRILGNI